MKLIYKIFILVLITNIDLHAQYDFPFNLNRAYISDSKGYRIIKSRMTYDSGDYLAETFNYFDKEGLNTLTVDYYKGEKQGFVKLLYNSERQMIEFKNYSKWINSYDSINSSYWDSTLIAWENNYEYDSIGRVISCSNQWYDDNQKPEFRQELKIEYDNYGRIIKKTEYNIDQSDSNYRIYFEPNSTKIAANQDYSSQITYINMYKYHGDTIIIENYRQGIIKTIQRIIKSEHVEKEYLLDPNGNELRTKTRVYNTDNNIIEERCVGDCAISFYGEYGDGMTYDTIKFEYSSTGLLSKETFFDSKFNSKKYIEYEYLK